MKKKNTRLSQAGCKKLNHKNIKWFSNKYYDNKKIS